MKPLLVLIGCEESQTICMAFRALGHEAYSCDLLPCSGKLPEYHLQMDVFKAFNLKKWNLAIFHPPCTYLTISANKWYKDQPARKSGVLVGAARQRAREDAIKFFMKFTNLDCPHIAIENPIGVMSTVYRKPDQIIQPWQFGHNETKATCLWLKNLPILKPTNIVEGREQRIFHLSPSKDRVKLRSKTYQGIADAIASQWSEYIMTSNIFDSK